MHMHTFIVVFTFVDEEYNVLLHLRTYLYENIMKYEYENILQI